MADPLEINRQNWDERATIHARDATGDYMLDRFRAGEDALHAIEAVELGDIYGKRVLHLQCHIGRDTLCLVRRGAVATGLDFSGAALEVARDASGNRVIGDSIRGAIGQVREGQALSESLERTGHFPDLALEMIRVGEQTGSLPDMLNHVADFYDEDVNIKSTALLSWVEPMILMFVAGFIAFVLISLYMPIFSLGSAVQG